MARDRSSRTEAKALRLFVAFEVPQRERDAVEVAIAPLRERHPRARWVPRENWHVTLKFLGATWPRLVEWVHTTVGEVAAVHPAFETRLRGLGSFPSARRARVLWVGLDDGGGAMAELAQALDGALAREFKPENRAFSAHLTVARSDPPVELPESFVDTPVGGEGFRVERLVLFRSHLKRPAPLYEPLASLPLGG